MKEAHQHFGHLESNCEVCARNKAIPRPQSAMKLIQVVPVPFCMVGVDLISPLKLNRQDNKYILTIIDYYMKYAEAIALPNQESKIVVELWNMCLLGMECLQFC